MFIFNTTFVVTTPKFENWQNWLTGAYIPLLKKLVASCEVAVYEVISSENKEEKTISVQWKVATPSELETINKQSPQVLGQMSSEFGQDALYFSSILKAL